MVQVAKKAGAGEKTHSLTVLPDRFVDVATKHFRLYLMGQILVISPYLAAREAGKYYCLYSRWPNADLESEVLVLRRKGRMGPSGFCQNMKPLPLRWCNVLNEVTPIQ